MVHHTEVISTFLINYLAGSNTVWGNNNNNSNQNSNNGNLMFNQNNNLFRSQSNVNNYGNNNQNSGANNLWPKPSGSVVGGNNWNNWSNGNNNNINNSWNNNGNNGMSNNNSWNNNANNNNGLRQSTLNFNSAGNNNNNQNGQNNGWGNNNINNNNGGNNNTWGNNNNGFNQSNQNRNNVSPTKSLNLNSSNAWQNNSNQPKFNGFGSNNNQFGQNNFQTNSQFGNNNNNGFNNQNNNNNNNMFNRPSNGPSNFSTGFNNQQNPTLNLNIYGNNNNNNNSQFRPTGTQLNFNSSNNNNSQFGRSTNFTGSNSSNSFNNGFQSTLKFGQTGTNTWGQQGTGGFNSGSNFNMNSGGMNNNQNSVMNQNAFNILQQMQRQLTIPEFQNKDFKEKLQDLKRSIEDHICSAQFGKLNSNDQGRIAESNYMMFCNTLNEYMDQDKKSRYGGLLGRGQYYDQDKQHRFHKPMLYINNPLRNQSLSVLSQDSQKFGILLYNELKQLKTFSNEQIDMIKEQEDLTKQRKNLLEKVRNKTNNSAIMAEKSLTQIIKEEKRASKISKFIFDQDELRYLNELMKNTNPLYLYEENVFEELKFKIPFDQCLKMMGDVVESCDKYTELIAQNKYLVDEQVNKEKMSDEIQMSDIADESSPETKYGNYIQIIQNATQKENELGFILQEQSYDIKRERDFLIQGVVKKRRASSVKYGQREITIKEAQDEFEKQKNLMQKEIMKNANVFQRNRSVELLTKLNQDKQKAGQVSDQNKLHFKDDVVDSGLIDIGVRLRKRERDRSNRDYDNLANRMRRVYIDENSIDRNRDNIERREQSFIGQKLRQQGFTDDRGRAADEGYYTQRVGARDQSANRGYSQIANQNHSIVNTSAQMKRYDRSRLQTDMSNVTPYKSSNKRTIMNNRLF
ncbi:UNKNOWN [Stylonychia lemnae]|uniref:Uncharacterized protein n=1 Tax=Stylonychia lemnae TaxID=5949 RepID=A0A078B0B3_STYLE|nr:UNKNOWN [Stylonychia lemnae]|eukprot:CDW87756.1 UNKNOWN [Stylonychia lemnae]